MQKDRRLSKHVRSALARAVNRYGVTFVGEFLGCSRTLILSIISGEYNPTSRSVEIINRWHTHRKNNRRAYQIWCQYQKELKQLASINRGIRWIMNQEIFKKTSPEYWDDILFAVSKAHEAARSRTYDKLHDLKQKEVVAT